MALAFLLFSINDGLGQNTAFKRLLPQVRNSVLTVYAENDEGNVFASGSGFVISTYGVCVTNFHVLEGAYGGHVKNAKGETFKIKGILDYSPSLDLVKFTIEKNSARKFTPLPVTVQSAKQGDDIMSYSTPLGVFENTMSTGVVSSVRQMKGYGKVLQITAPISHGSSGSPVINSLGNVVGIATFGFENGQSLNFAVDATSLRKLNRTLNIPVGEMRRNRLETARVKLAKRYGEAGEFSNAITFLDKEIEINPINDLAYYYRGLYKCRDNNYRDGIPDLLEACRLDTTNISYYVKVGTFLRNMAIMEWDNTHEVNENLLSLAESITKHSVTLDPYRGEPLADFGYILYYVAHQKNGIINKEVLAKAKSLLDMAVEVMPVAEVYDIRGSINTALKNLGDALLDYDKEISLSPNDYRGYESRADIKIFEFGQIDEGILDLERAYALAQKNYEKADVLGLKAKALEIKAFQLPPNAGILIGDAITAYDEAYKLTNDESYLNLKMKLVDRVKTHIREYGSFPQLSLPDE